MLPQRREGGVLGGGQPAVRATATSSVEGAAAEDGRKPSIWDTFVHDGYSIDNATGDVTADQYHKYKEDVKLLHEMGVDAYRMSIAWPRLIPDGRGAVNPKGLEYYNNLIDELLNYEPYIVAHHLLLAHASAVSVYREKYQADQGGRIGLTLLGWWNEPATETPDDIEAAERMNDFHIGWLDPLLISRSFLKPNSQFLFGLTNDFMKSAPWALKKLLKHLRVKYKNPAVMIHENGNMGKMIHQNTTFLRNG
nr:unnamed protein product [Digitaria exilis]